MSEARGQPEFDSGDLLPCRLREEVSRAARHRLPLALLVFDVRAPREDEPQVGALTRAAVLFTRGMVRKSDVVGPLGRGQFGVVANATREGAGALAQSLARQLCAYEFASADRPVAVRVRYAVSCLSNTKTADDLLNEARSALEAGTPTGSEGPP